MIISIAFIIVQLSFGMARCLALLFREDNPSCVSLCVLCENYFDFAWPTPPLYCTPCKTAWLGNAHAFLFFPFFVMSWGNSASIFLIWKWTFVVRLSTNRRTVCTNKKYGLYNKIYSYYVLQKPHSRLKQSFWNFFRCGARPSRSDRQSTFIFTQRSLVSSL